MLTVIAMNLFKFNILGLAKKCLFYMEYDFTNIPMY